ncbi:MAG: helix-turn-helix domain-containing protein [Gemmatimonadetes bacterium]|nr:helix-turn-helix domain-containing protein [Gemmatimonadota bacterium]
MDKRLNRAARRALDAALTSMRMLAEESGVHPTTVARWRVGLANVGPESALRLARVLRRRAARLVDAAERLKQAARKEGEHAEK